MNLLTADGEWSAEDRLALESQLVLATQGPLCLDPSPAISIVSNHMQYHRRALNTEPLRRCAKKFSQVMRLRTISDHLNAEVKVIAVLQVVMEY